MHHRQSENAPREDTVNVEHHHHGEGTHEMNDAIAEEAHHAVHALDVANMRPVNEFRRSVILTAGTFAMICASTSYAFNIFSGSLQKKYNYDSRAMSTINTVGMVFAYFLIPYAYLCDYLGPLPIYIIACSLFTIGALLMGLTFRGVIEGSVAKLAVFNAFLSLGAQLFDTATIVCVMLVFPTRRGWVIGILKTMMGLGSAIIGSLKIGFFNESPDNYFFFLIAVVLFFGIIAIFLVRMPSYELTGYQKSHLSLEEKTRRQSRRAAYLAQKPNMIKFYLAYGIMLILIVYLPVTSAVVAFLKLGANVARAFAIVTIIIVCLLLLMLVPFHRWNWTISLGKKHHAYRENDAAEEEPVKDTTGTSQDANGRTVPVKEVVTDIDFIAPQYQTTFFQSLKTLRFLCIFWTMLCSMSTGYIAIFNARFIYAALLEGDVSESQGTLLTVVVSAASAVGRITMSIIESITQSGPAEKRFPLTIVFFVPTIVMVFANIFFLVLPGRSLLLAFALTAFANGFCASVSALVVRVIYAKDPARHYQFGLFALCVGSILFNRCLYGEWYAKEAEKLGVKVCEKKVCLKVPLIVILVLNATSLLSNTYIHISYVRFCKVALEERRRLKESKAAEAAAAGNMTVMISATVTGKNKVNHDVLSMDDEPEEDIVENDTNDERAMNHEK